MKTIESERNKEDLYRISYAPDLRNCFYIGLILLCTSVIPVIFLEDYELILSELQIMGGFAVFLLIMGVLGWKLDKTFQVSEDSMTLKISNVRWGIPIFSRKFALTDCIGFDIQFKERYNSYFLLLLFHRQKPYRVILKRDKDALNYHLLKLNQFLSQFSNKHGSVSMDEIHAGIPMEDSVKFANSKVIRDQDHRIVGSNRSFLAISFICFALPVVLVYAGYLSFHSSSSLSKSPLMLVSIILIALNFMGIVYIFFLLVRVKNLELDAQYHTLGGTPLINPPSWLSRYTKIMKVFYIPPNRKTFYLRLRLSLLLEGMASIIGLLLLFFVF